MRHIIVSLFLCFALRFCRSFHKMVFPDTIVLYDSVVDVPTKEVVFMCYSRCEKLIEVQPYERLV